MSPSERWCRRPCSRLPESQGRFRCPAVWPPRGVFMGSAPAQTPAVGSYTSAEARAGALLPVRPPARSTIPETRTARAIPSHGSAKLSVADHRPVDGSYNAQDAVSVRGLSLARPPVTRTFPSASSAPRCPYTAVGRSSVNDQVPRAGSYSSHEANWLPGRPAAPPPGHEYHPARQPGRNGDAPCLPQIPGGGPGPRVGVVYFTG